MIFFFGTYRWWWLKHVGAFYSYSNLQQMIKCTCYSLLLEVFSKMVIEPAMSSMILDDCCVWNMKRVGIGLCLLCNLYLFCLINSAYVIFSCLLIILSFKTCSICIQIWENSVLKLNFWSALGYPMGQQGHMNLSEWVDPWPLELALGPWG
jgi:hypothetical protein